MPFYDVTRRICHSASNGVVRTVRQNFVNVDRTVNFLIGRDDTLV